MLTKILENLKTKEIINESKVDNLRSYIRSKYPEHSARDMSAIFADAVNKIIDTNIHGFDEEDKRGIRAGVLKNAINKGSFSIYAEDIFTSCLMQNKQDEEYISKFTSWVNSAQEFQISKDNLLEFVIKAKQYEAAMLYSQLQNVAKEIEAAVSLADRVSTIVEDYREASREEFSAAPIVEEESDEPIRHMEAPYTGGMEAAALDAVEAQWLDALSDLLHDDAKTVSKEMNETAMVLAEVYSTEEKIENEWAADAVKPAGVSLKRAAAGVEFGALLKHFVELLEKECKDLAHYIRYEARFSRFALRIAIVLMVLASGMFVLQRSYSSSNYAGDFFIVPVSCTNINDDQLDRYLSLDSKIKYKISKDNDEFLRSIRDGLHEDLRYTVIDREALKKWLNKKNSLLAEEPYFSAIVETSKKYDVHPFLMFAIAGQEQGFVPKNNGNAKKIANNPFNVYGSWQDYNTNIYDAAELAANVIIKSSKDRPVYMNAIKWINRKYAEDENWWKSVSSIFYKMKSEI